MSAAKEPASTAAAVNAATRAADNAGKLSRIAQLMGVKPNTVVFTLTDLLDFEKAAQSDHARNRRPKKTPTHRNEVTAEMRLFRRDESNDLANFLNADADIHGITFTSMDKKSSSDKTKKYKIWCAAILPLHESEKTVSLGTLRVWWTIAKPQAKPNSRRRPGNAR